MRYVLSAITLILGVFFSIFQWGPTVKIWWSVYLGFCGLLAALIIFCLLVHQIIQKPFPTMSRWKWGAFSNFLWLPIHLFLIDKGETLIGTLGLLICFSFILISLFLKPITEPIK